MQPWRRIILAGGLLAALFGPLAAVAQVPPAVPALPDTERRTAYSITGTTCACAVNFAIYGDSTDVDEWIQVWVNGTRYLSTDPTFGWSLSSVTGSLSTIPRPITDAVLTFNAVQTGTVQIVGARRPRQLTQFTEGRGVAARDLNQRLTDITAIERELWDKTNDVTGRAILSQPGNTVGPLPLPAGCVSSYLGFDGTGLNPVCIAATQGSGNVVGASPSVSGNLPKYNTATGNGITDSGIAASNVALLSANNTFTGTDTFSKILSTLNINNQVNVTDVIGVSLAPSTAASEVVVTRSQLQPAGSGTQSGGGPISALDGDFLIGVSDAASWTQPFASVNAYVGSLGGGTGTWSTLSNLMTSGNWLGSTVTQLYGINIQHPTGTSGKVTNYDALFIPAATGSNPVTGTEHAINSLSTADSVITGRMQVSSLWLGNTSPGATSVFNSSGNVVYNVPTGDGHFFNINGSTVAEINAAGGAAFSLPVSSTGSILSTGATGVGYATGAGGTVTQLTSRTTGVTINKPTGQITMFAAAGSATAATFTVTNSAVAATDTISLSVKSATNLYELFVTAVAAGSFNITFLTTGGTSSDAPVINFNVIKGAAN